MRAFVTGASGFLGSYLVDALVRGGHETAILHRPDTNLWRIETLLPQLTPIVGDINSLTAARPRIEAFAPDVILHLAWHGVGNRHRNDEAQLTGNLQGTLDLVKLGRELGCKAWIGLGSQAEYGPQANVISETAMPSPTTMYGATKLSACILANQLLAESNTRFAWLRLFSSYGPKDSPEWMIPYLIRSLLNGERPSLTAGEQLWDYLYIADAAEAILRVAESPSAHGIYNLGSGRVSRLRALIETIRDIIDPTLPLGFGEVPYRPDQVMHLEADITKLKNDIGWIPLTDINEGLRRTIDWHVQTSI